MSTASPGSQIQISDLMEASFWEANKGRIFAIVAVVVVGVVGWQIWTEQKVKTEEAAWDQFRAGITGNKDTAAELAGTSPESWALFHDASRAYSEGRFEDTIANIRRLKERFPTSPNVVSQEADTLLADAEAEVAWSKGHVPVKENAAIPDDLTLTITTDAGDVQIGLYPEVAPTLSRSFLKLVRDGVLKAAAIEAVVADNYVTFTLALPDETKAEDVAAVGDVERASLRLAKSPSHFAGAVSFEIVDDASEAEEAETTPPVEKPKKLRLMIATTDMTYRDNQAMTFGMVKKGLDILKEISKREVDEKGMLKTSVKVQGVTEAAGLTAIH